MYEELSGGGRVMALSKSTCDNCVNTECLWRAPTGGNDPPVMICPNKIEKPKTNGDKVRAMTDEQLAQFILNTIARICAKVGKKNEASIKENFAQAGLYCQFEIWLKERAEE